VAVAPQSTEKITDAFAALSVLGLFDFALALRGMNHAQNFTGCSGDFDDRAWSDYFAR
jgi:hypothetical protein